MKKQTKNPPRILFAGGGSGGPVAPLLAIAEQVKHLSPNADFFWIGTKKGPERHMTNKAGIQFQAIATGKLRRYWSMKNLATPFQVIVGFFQALSIIKKIKPTVAMGAGGFVQVPVLWAAKFCGVPVIIHQQDVIPTLANRLCAPIAKKITVTFEQSLKDFSSGLGFLSEQEERIIHTGHPIRDFVAQGDKTAAKAFFGLHSELPTLFVIGGGTGAEAINKLVTDELSELAKIVQIIHVTGAGKSFAIQHENYHAYEFLDRVDYAYAIADMVISRAGLNLISELSINAKVSIIIAIPESHQEANALMLARKRAAIVIDQRDLNPFILRKIVRAFLFEPKLQRELSENIFKLMPHNGAQTIAKLLLQISK